MANTFKSAATGSRTDLLTMYTCPTATTAVVHAMYLSNVDGTNDATVNIAISGSAYFDHRNYLLKTVFSLGNQAVITSQGSLLGMEVRVSS